jgi:prevent-host-death family protein
VTRDPALITDLCRLDRSCRVGQLGLVKLVKISDAKNHLSRHLEYVRRGGRIRIVDRETPVADLIPVEPAPGGGDDRALLADLERRGLVTRGRSGPFPAALLRKGPGAPDADVLGALLEERRRSR